MARSGFGRLSLLSTHLYLAGAGAADSWAIDCHKWLNVPYDSGAAVVRTPEHLQAAMSVSAAYLTPGFRTQLDRCRNAHFGHLNCI